nr:MAG TPA: hypothetical protein [Caudoviricetes sp.]
MLLSSIKWLLLFPPTALRPPQKRLQHFCGGSQRGKKPPFRGFFHFSNKIRWLYQKKSLTLQTARKEMTSKTIK